jgi:RNA polymerase sigma-70 factor, ECF subfamily
VFPFQCAADAPADWLQCLAAARSGSPAELGRLLDEFRPYLLALAASELDHDLRTKVGPSDLVQDSLLEGQRDFADFRGAQPDELRGWLRQILLHNAENLRRQYHGTAMRDVGREVPLPGGPASGDGGGLLSDSSSPSQVAGRREDLDRVRDALAGLPEHYRSVILWRNRDGESFATIGTRLGRTAEASRLLWFRALKRLRDELGG